MFSCLGSVTCVRILGLNIYLPNDCVDCAGAVRSCCSYCPSMSLVPYGRSFRPPWRSVSLELLILHPPRLFFAFIGNGKSLKNRWQHWCCRFPLAKILAAKLFSPFFICFSSWHTASCKKAGAHSFAFSHFWHSRMASGQTPHWAASYPIKSLTLNKVSISFSLPM